MDKAFVFDRAGRCEPASDAAFFDCDELNRRPVRWLIWGVGITTTPDAEVTVVLANLRPWAQAAVLARCGMIMSRGGSVEVYAPSLEAYDEFAMAVSGLAWWATTLGNPDHEASSKARVWCSTILTQNDFDRSDPGNAAAHEAILGILIDIGVGGHV